MLRGSSLLTAIGSKLFVNDSSTSSTPALPNGPLIDGYVCTSDHRYAFIDPKVAVPRPTLWQKARYVVSRFLASVLAAIGAAFPAWRLYLGEEQAEKQMVELLGQPAAEYAASLPALIAGPLVLLLAAAYLWYSGCGHYHTVMEWDAMRGRALLSEYEQIVTEHGLAKAALFITPRELRTKLIEQVRKRGLASVLLANDADVLAWVHAGMLLRDDEARPVALIQTSMRDARRLWQDTENVLNHEMAVLMGEQAKKRDRLIADAELSCLTSAEAKLMEEYSGRRNDRINAARRERDEKLAKLEKNFDELLLDDETKRKVLKKRRKIEHKYEQVKVLEERICNERQLALVPVLQARTRARDDAITKARSDYEEQMQAMEAKHHTNKKRAQAKAEYEKRVAELTGEWEKLVSRTLDKNTGQIADRVAAEKA